MYDEEELKLLDDEIGLDEPLDPLEQIEALNEEEVTQPEPEEMLALLENPQPEQRMLAARAFCD
ncbi:MAG: HEAT repeat domain-containing protein, partial [Richelia sp.]|nr:HEAT repeat domain-containing protein [Richelia sp.]